MRWQELSFQCVYPEMPIKHVPIKMSSFLFSCWVISDSLQSHGLQHARLPRPLPSPGACSNFCPLSRWCHPTILSSVIPFSSCRQSCPASGSFPMSCLFTSGGQSIGISASASVFPITRVFYNESVLHIRWPKYWSFSFYISPSKEYSGLMSFRIDWLELHEVQGSLKCLLQHHS